VGGAETDEIICGNSARGWGFVSVTIIAIASSYTRAFFSSNDSPRKANFISSAAAAAAGGSSFASIAIANITTPCPPSPSPPLTHERLVLSPQLQPHGESLGDRLSQRIPFRTK